MAAHRLGVGVGGHQRLRGNLRHVPEKFRAGVGNIDEDARLLHGLYSLAAKLRQARTARGHHAPAQLGGAVPGQGAHPHAQALALLDALQLAAQHRSALHREDGSVTPLAFQPVQVAGATQLLQGAGVFPHLPGKALRHLQKALPGSLPPQVVRKPHGVALHVVLPVLYLL